jgi:hypothetical protein
MKRFALPLAIAAMFAVNSIPAPTQGDGGGGGGCPSGHLAFSQEIAVCAPYPFFYLEQETHDVPMCVGGDIWVYLLASSSAAGHLDWNPQADSFGGEITYDATHLSFIGYSLGYVGPYSSLTYTSPGHLAVSISGGIPPEPLQILALHFSKIGTSIPNSRVDINLFPVMCYYPNGDYLSCSGLEQFCEAGGTVRQTP